MRKKTRKAAPPMSAVPRRAPTMAPTTVEVDDEVDEDSPFDVVSVASDGNTGEDSDSDD
jgi:hypothetical protein